MALARVVSFEGVTQEAVDQTRARIDAGDAPEGMPPCEVAVLFDAAAGRSLVVFFFANEEDYAAGDAILDAMPAEETHGRRTGVARYEVAIRTSI